ncbi:MAG: HAMP domain-containing sensor histidine kinase [Eubacteriales bacterium]|nr:HAMP domain-containing sensor histidine kinase [Eubacteriales bacterium]
MKKKKSMQRQLTLLVGIILLLCNLVLIALLNYAISIALEDMVLTIGDLQIKIYPIDDFSNQIRTYGYLFAIFTTGLGTVLTYVMLGKYLFSLKALSQHMDHVSRHNLSEPVEMVSTAIEVSSLIDSFNNMMQRLNQSFVMQRDFSSYVAHELKTPLAILQTKMEVYQQKEVTKSNMAEMLTTLSAQIQKMNDTVSKTLELFQIERIALDEKVPLDILLEDVLTDLEDIAAEQHIALQTDTAISEWNSASEQAFMVIGNYTLLYQAFFNLVNNAIKYSAQGSSVFVQAKSNVNNIVIEVADGGMGIADKDKELIFEPFFRGDTGKKDGTGLGLAFAQKVFAHHHAAIEVKDNQPKGTVMCVVFERENR